MPVKVQVRGLHEVTKKYRGKLAGFKKFMLEFSREYSKKLLKRILDVGFSGRPGTIPRTHRLRKSYRTLVQTTPRAVNFSVFSNYISAELHEKGGTVTPKTRRNLAIPLDSARDALGVPTFVSPHLDIVYPGRFRVVRPKGTKKGTWLYRVFLKDVQTGQITHVLQPSAYIPPRTKVEETFTKYLPTIRRQFTIQFKRFIDSK